MAPPQTHSNLKFIGTASFLIILVNLNVIWEVLWRGNVQLYEEGQFVETLTAASFLCGAVILFAAAFFRQGLSRLLTASLATVNLTGFLREIDMADYNIPSPIRELVSNDVKDTILALVFVALVFVALKNYRHRVRDVFRSFLNSMGGLLVLGGLFFLTANVAEQLDREFAEELLEANAAMAFLCGCLLFDQRRYGNRLDEL